MRTLTEPPWDDWKLASGPSADRQSLAYCVNKRADSLGSARLVDTERVIATGHQAWLWHPGILAKDLAMANASGRLKACRLHVVIDQDVHNTLMLQVPHQKGQKLSIQTIQLAEHDTNVPTGAQPPVDTREVIQSLGAINHDGINRLAEAFTDLPSCPTLAEQIALVLMRLIRPFAGNLPICTVSDFVKLPAYGKLLDELRLDAEACVKAYNNAVQQYPSVRIAPLHTQANRVEVPLWAVEWLQLRRRVFVDLKSSSPKFVGSDGQPIDQSKGKLLPRALLQSAFLRSACCDLFIHGTGGAAYDPVTEAWWKKWRGTPLAPWTVVSADIQLDFNAPIVCRDELAQAIWYRHHLPHNIDRLLPLDGQAAQQKQNLLSQMNLNRDPIRRAQVYAKIRQINEELAASYPDALAESQSRVQHAAIGFANSRIAQRREWCFTLYRPDQIHRLRELLTGLG